MIKTWWPALVPVVLGLMFFAYGKWERHKERTDLRKDVKIEKLEDQNTTLKKDVNTRKKQNEILVRDITPSDFDNILRKREF